MSDLVLHKASTSLVALPTAPPRDRNPYLVYLYSLAPNSRTTMRSVLTTIAARFHCEPEVFPWQHLRYQHLMAIRAELMQSKAPRTVNKMLNGLRRVLLECRRLGLITPDQYTAAADVQPVRGSRLPAGRALSLDEIQALLASSAKTVYRTKSGKLRTHETPALGIRNRALILLLAGAGLRRTELSTLALEDYRRRDRTVRVQGKGNKERLVPLHPTIVEALDQWVALRGSEPGALFYRGRKGDVIESGPSISPTGIHEIIQRLAKQADLTQVSPHDFRRTFITNVLEQEHDLAVAANLAGHSSTDTTRRYDRRGEKAMRAAINAMDLSFKRKTP